MALEFRNRGSRIKRTSVTRDPKNAIGDTYINAFFDSATLPIISVLSISKIKISLISGMNDCAVSFRSDIDLLEWEARADSSGVGQGLLVGNGSTVVANQDVNFDILGTALTSGDKSYSVDIYGRSLLGWSIRDA